MYFSTYLLYFTVKTLKNYLVGSFHRYYTLQLTVTVLSALRSNSFQFGIFMPLSLVKLKELKHIIFSPTLFLHI